MKETESEWQPQVRAQARQRATTSGGLIVKFRATLGFTANGSSDHSRVRDLSITVWPSHAALILATQEEGATDTDLHKAVAEAIADAYFRQAGGGCGWPTPGMPTVRSPACATPPAAPRPHTTRVIARCGRKLGRTPRSSSAA
ncbi:telomere-protecting terminal protein Tpg [Streptomyces sp. NPDC003027]